MMPAATESIWLSARSTDGFRPRNSATTSLSNASTVLSAQRVSASSSDGREAEEDQPQHVARRAPVADDVVVAEHLDCGRSGTARGPASMRSVRRAEPQKREELVRAGNALRLHGLQLGRRLHDLLNPRVISR